MFEKKGKKTIDEKEIVADKSGKPEEIAKTEEIKTVFEEMRKDNKELIETLQKLQAEFENYKKREEKGKDEFVKYCTASTFLEFLEFMDSFENAVEKCSTEQKQALEPLYRQLKTFLEKKGIVSFESGEEKFNPEKHEALQTSFEENTPDSTVLEEFKKGYLMYGKVLRHAQVRVNKKLEKEMPEEKSNEKENIKAKSNEKQAGEKQENTAMDGEEK